MAAGHPEYASEVTRRRVIGLLVMTGLTASATAAGAHGVYAPVGQVLGRDMQNLASQLLAQWISDTRQEILAAGTQPMAAQIVEGLAGYFSPDLLREVSFRTGDITDLSLPALAFQYGDAAAITLVDVVMFNHPSDAQTDLKLWAHELTHVMQYRRWGIDGFAARYVADSSAVEREAYGNADRFMIWRSTGSR